MLGFSCVEIGGGKAGIEAAGAQAEQHGGKDEDSQGVHNAHYLTRLVWLGKRLV